jgi:glyoxylase-like metal-dependent hydrolase (beta-lactamase superfamily II)
MRQYRHARAAAVLGLGLLVSSPALRSAESTAGQRAANPRVPQDKGYLVEEVRDGLYWVTDGAYNTMFLVSTEGVVAVDPVPTLGPRYLRAIGEVTDKPVTHVVYSHEHTDHIGAANLFPKNVTIVAHEETARVLAARNDPRRPVPTVTFDDRYTLKVGDQTLELEYRGNNHTPGNIFIYAPKQKVLMLVDVVYPGYMPYKNLGITEDVQGYIKAHADLLSYDFTTLVAGHVTRLGTRDDVKTASAFLEDLEATCAGLLASLSFPGYLQSPVARRLAETEGRSKWDLHNEYEHELESRCAAVLSPRWRDRLTDADTYLRDNCWAMIEALTVQLPPAPPEVEESGKGSFRRNGGLRMKELGDVLAEVRVAQPSMTHTTVRTRGE